MSLGISNVQWPADRRVEATLAADASYPNPAGYPLLATAFALSRFTRVDIAPTAGFIFDVVLSADATSAAIHVMEAPGGGGSGNTGNTTAVNASSAVTGTGTFTGTSPVSALNLATPAFSGTGLTAAGQAITTTDNQTMTLNQCAGMWLISATGATPPNLILSNTAVTGAPAVLTVQGAASTDAGAYKIVKALTPIGAVSALSGTAAAQIQTQHLHTFSGTSGAGPFVEVANATNLSSLLASISATVYGY